MCQTSPCRVKLSFLAPQAGECLANGARLYAASITGENYSGNWVEACRNTSAEINGTPYPSRNCSEHADRRVWGEFEVADPTCHTRVRGRIRYQDFGSRITAKGEVRSVDPLTGPGNTKVVRDVRRARVEISYGTGGRRDKRVTETLDDGTFDTYVPSDTVDNYRVVIVARNPAGQVNLRENTATWYFTPEHRVRKHPDGDGFVLEPPSGLDLSDPNGDAMSFNAADVLLVAYDYAVAHRVPRGAPSPARAYQTGGHYPQSRRAVASDDPFRRVKPDLASRRSEQYELDVQ